MLIKIFLSTIMLSFFSGALRNCNNKMNQKITVIGAALEDKEGAIVETDKGDYLLDGLDEWGEKYYGKKVRVMGRLKVETHKKQSIDSGLQVQERVGTVLIIKKPKWSLVE